MRNGNHQLEYLISESMERVAQDGRNAETVDIMLAGFGYLAYEIQKPQWWSVKRVVPIAFGLGGTFGVGVLGVILKWLGGN